MADYDLLTIRLDALTADLEGAETALDNPKLGDLAGLVRNRFEVQFGRLHRKVGGLVEALDNNDAESRRETWEMYRKYQAKSDHLIEECADFIQGALARSANVDLGAAEVADDLAEYLANITEIGWSKMTIFGEMDFTTRSSGIIRLAFPHFDVWSIPIVGHEFGHHVIEELRDATGAQDDKDREVFPVIDVVNKHKKDSGLKRQWGRELFSDFFATYSLGPAFVVSLIFGQLDAVYPHSPSATHPKSSWRAAFSLAALDRLGSGTGINPFATLAESVRGTWSEAMLSAGQADDVPAEELEQLNTLLDDFWSVLVDNTPKTLQYSAWTRAQQLSLQITAAAGNRHANPPFEFLKSTDTVRDVLNGAWRARLLGEAPTDDIAEISLRVARAAMG